mmetsp:Transcript_9002/g.33158  ORF Transcript_9002/g.33158 Transcript_9002/m.33158 type:complete len:225 (+) Transcript_9002:448-1122(+)
MQAAPCRSNRRKAPCSSGAVRRRSAPSSPSDAAAATAASTAAAAAALAPARPAADAEAEDVPVVGRTRSIMWKCSRPSWTICAASCRLSSTASCCWCSAGGGRASPAPPRSPCGAAALASSAALPSARAAGAAGAGDGEVEVEGGGALLRSTRCAARCASWLVADLPRLLPIATMAAPADGEEALRPRRSCGCCSGALQHAASQPSRRHRPPPSRRPRAHLEAE